MPPGKCSFGSYMENVAYSEGLKAKEIIEGFLRINQKNYEEAYINSPDGSMDICINGVNDRNAALHGDLVGVKILPKEEWRILYENLDVYLEDNPNSKTVVYEPLLEIERDKNKDDLLQSLPHTETLDQNTSEKSKRIRKGRGKKKKNDIVNEPLPDMEISVFNPENIESLSKIPAADAIETPTLNYQYPENTELLPQFQTTDTKETSTLNYKHLNRDKSPMTKPGVVVVPPDQLSECDFTDDDSGCSQIFDEDELNREYPKIRVAPHYQRNNDKDWLIDLPHIQPIPFGDTESESVQFVNHHHNMLISFVEGVVEHQRQCFLEQQQIPSQVQQPLLGIAADESNSPFLNLKSPRTFLDEEIEPSNTAIIDVLLSEAAPEPDDILLISSNVPLTEEQLSEPKNTQINDYGECSDVSGGVECGLNSSSTIENTDNLQTFNIAEMGSLSLNEANSVDNKIHGANSVDNKIHEANSVDNKIHEANSVDNKIHEANSVDNKIDEANSVDNNFHELNFDSYSNDFGNEKVFKEILFKSKVENRKENQRFLRKKNKKQTNKNNASQKMQNVKRTEPSLKQVIRLPNWEKFIQRTGYVVKICEEIHSRKAAGVLKAFGDKNPNYALFSPMDNRIPRMRIPIEQCPHNFLLNAINFDKIIYLARIAQWTLPAFARGELIKTIGNRGELKAEEEAILASHDVDFQPFPEDVLSDLPSLPWSIPAEEFANRIDLRTSCIFTIDPSTARDLDDAVSCLALPSGNFRIGVHIADVSYFIKPDSPLDKVASERGNSFYLPDQVITMLPSRLSEELCSLNPGEDKLAFSIIWEFTPGGKIIGEWYGKTIIRSCIKLSYDHAQTMIEKPFAELSTDDFPPVENGFNLSHIYAVVERLQSIAVLLRKKRMESGILRLDQVRVAFTLDEETFTPNGIATAELRDSNRLIEEFMLLANSFVANKIYKHFPQLSVLRNHPPPHETALENTVTFLKKNGIHLDPSTAGSLHSSILRYNSDDKYTRAKMQAVVNMCSKPMQFARYFCTGTQEDKESYHHYALNIPFYTHFTSPIRRYPDVMVHRILAAVIKPSLYEMPMNDSSSIQHICNHCNTKKQTSKLVQEACTELYLAEFIRISGGLTEEGIIMGVLDRSVDIFILKFGIIKRCYLEKLDGATFTKVPKEKALLVKWKRGALNNGEGGSQKLDVFTLVDVILKPYEDGSLKFNAFILRPTSFKNSN